MVWYGMVWYGMVWVVRMCVNRMKWEAGIWRGRTGWDGWVCLCCLDMVCTSRY